MDTELKLTISNGRSLATCILQELPQSSFGVVFDWPRIGRPIYHLLKEKLPSSNVQKSNRTKIGTDMLQRRTSGNIYCLDIPFYKWQRFINFLMRDSSEKCWVVYSDRNKGRDFNSRMSPKILPPISPEDLVFLEHRIGVPDDKRSELYFFLMNAEKYQREAEKLIFT